MHDESDLQSKIEVSAVTAQTPKSKIDITVVPASIVRLAAGGTRFVVHACPVGRWASEIAGVITRNWPEGRAAFLQWVRRGDQKLGQVQYLWCNHPGGICPPGEPRTWVVSMIARDDKNVIVPEHIECALQKVARRAVEFRASVHMRAGIIDKRCDVATILAGIPTYLYVGEQSSQEGEAR